MTTINNNNITTTPIAVTIIITITKDKFQIVIIIKMVGHIANNNNTINITNRTKDRHTTIIRMMTMVDRINTMTATLEEEKYTMTMNTVDIITPNRMDTTTIRPNKINIRVAKEDQIITKTTIKRKKDTIVDMKRESPNITTSRKRLKILPYLRYSIFQVNPSSWLIGNQTLWRVINLLIQKMSHHLIRPSTIKCISMNMEIRFKCFQIKIQ